MKKFFFLLLLTLVVGCKTPDRKDPRNLPIYPTMPR